MEEVKRCQKCGKRQTKIKFSNGNWTSKKETRTCLECIKRQQLPKHPRRTKTSHPEWRVWYGMIQRCTNDKHTAWACYGGRGIKVCRQWREDFWQFLHDMGPRPDGYSIDRIDVNGDYEPKNCRWADWDTQANNKRDKKPIDYSKVKALNPCETTRRILGL